MSSVKGVDNDDAWNLMANSVQVELSQQSR